MEIHDKINKEFKRIDEYRERTNLSHLPVIIKTKRFKLVDKTKEAIEIKIIECDKNPNLLQEFYNKSSYGLFQPNSRNDDIDYREIYFIDDQDCKKKIGCIYITPELIRESYLRKDAVGISTSLEPEFQGKGFGGEIFMSYVKIITDSLKCDNDLPYHLQEDPYVRSYAITDPSVTLKEKLGFIKERYRYTPTETPIFKITSEKIKESLKQNKFDFIEDNPCFEKKGKHLDLNHVEQARNTHLDI